MAWFPRGPNDHTKTDILYLNMGKWRAARTLFICFIVSVCGDGINEVSSLHIMSVLSSVGIICLSVKITVFVNHVLICRKMISLIKSLSVFMAKIVEKRLKLYVTSPIKLTDKFTHVQLLQNLIHIWSFWKPWTHFLTLKPHPMFENHLMTRTATQILVIFNQLEWHHISVGVSEITWIATVCWTTCSA